MIYMIEAQHPSFDKKAALSLFLKHQHHLDDTLGFDFLTQRSLFFSVYRSNDHSFVGCVFAFCENNRIWVGGYAHRHRHRECVLALKRVCDFFPCVYAKTRHKSAAFCLRRAGFEPLSGRKNVFFRLRTDDKENRFIRVFFNDSFESAT